jgi:glycosyltransferase involved in cell wall biosynthesis
MRGLLEHERTERRRNVCKELMKDSRTRGKRFIRSSRQGQLATTRPTLLFIHASADLYGSDITLLQLVSCLVPNRFRAIVVLPYEGPLVARLREAGAEVLVCTDLPIIRRQNMNLKGALRLTCSLRAVWRLAGFIRRRNVALVHSNTLAVSLVGFAAVLARRPQVWHVHEIIVSPRSIAAVLATLSSLLSTVVVANSIATADHYRRTRLASSTPTRVVLNGVEESRVRARVGVPIRSVVEAGPRDVVFNLVGRINRWKGQSNLMDAELLAAELGGVRFLVVGDSFAGQEQLSDEVDRRIEVSDVLRRRAVRLPHTAEVGDVYEASDVIVVPSIEPEPFGLVAAEAMAAGLPVIASRLGALPEIVEDHRTGLVVDAGNAAALL